MAARKRWCTGARRIRFALAHWNGSREVEEQVKNDLKVTIRCIPLEAGEPGKCIFTGEPSAKRVIWAKSY